MLNLENTILLVIDMQGNLAHAMYEKNFLFANLQKMIKGAKIIGIPIIYTEQTPDKIGQTLPEFSDLLLDLEPISKKHFSCCGEKRFMEAFNQLNRNQVLITGCETHVCVYQTAIDLIKIGKEVHVVTDCVGSRTAENRSLGIEKMKSEGAKLSGTEMALFELMKTSEGDQFRQIAKLVK